MGGCPRCGRALIPYSFEVVSKNITHPLLLGWCEDCMNIVAYAVPNKVELLRRAVGIDATVPDVPVWRMVVTDKGDLLDVREMKVEMGVVEKEVP